MRGESTLNIEYSPDGKKKKKKKWVLCFNNRKCWFLGLDIPEMEFIICCTCAVLNRHLLKVCRRNDIFKQKM